MHKKIIKFVVLLLVFCGSIWGISLLTDTDNVDLTSEMPEATLPVIYLQKGNTYINQLFGCKGEMDDLSIRDTITPLSSDMILPVTIQTFQVQIEEISYEVRTMDTTRLLEDTKVENFTQTEGVVTAQLQIQNLLEEEQEYRLVITLKCKGEEVRYYTRIIRAENCRVDDSIQFALNFHEKTFDLTEAAQLALYLEPNAEGDNSTLQKVTIHSSLNQVAWGSFEGTVLKDPVPSLWEISSSYNTVKLNYVMASNGENGEQEFYNVEEYYRMRYSAVNDRMYLLDYERTMNEIFRGSGAHMSKNAILLGIRDQSVDFADNESGTIISFVQEGDLWSYNSVTNQLSLVFSFRGIEGINDRENNPSHAIRIMRVSETGSIDFAVYGYMNRGIHEGYTGIGVYHYDSIANTIQEELFVQSDEPYQLMKETWGKLFYVSDEGFFYMLTEDKLYKIRLEDGRIQVLCEGLAEENFVASADGRYVAWQDETEKNRLTVTDLDNERQWQVEGAPAEWLKPIGFVESDFVYGVSRQTEGGAAGRNHPMYRVVIVDKNQQAVKEYEKSGYFITDARVEASTVLLDRAIQSGEAYVAVEGDAIMSHELEASRTIQIGTIVTEQKQTQVRIITEQEFAAKSPQILTPQEIVPEQEKIVALKGNPAPGRYVIYGAGRVVSYTWDAAEAIRIADACAGIVLQEDYRYLWRRGRPASVTMANKVVLSQEEVDLAPDMTTRCLLGLLKAENVSFFDVGGLVNAGEEPARILQEAMPYAQVLDLTGCTLSQALYYVGQGNVVFALGENREPLLVAGYDEHNVILYDPITNTTFRKGLTDSEEAFLAAGNVFITYLKDEYPSAP